MFYMHTCRDTIYENKIFLYNGLVVIKLYRLKEDSETEIIIKKSQFITYLHTCFSEVEAKEYIQQIRKIHPNANHHCYAMIVGEHQEIQRSNDNGEPSGTAGMPMLQCLVHREMQDIVAITVRYFGGIKLGGGGLIRAYSKSVANALDLAKICKQVHMIKATLSFSYEMIGKIDYLFRDKHIDITDKIYDTFVTYTFLCKELPTEEVSEISSGVYLPEFMEDVCLYVEV